MNIILHAPEEIIDPPAGASPGVRIHNLWHLIPEKKKIVMDLQYGQKGFRIVTQRLFVIDAIDVDIMIP